MIGDAYRLLTPCLGNPSGAIGYVFNEYDDFDGKGTGIQLIFPNGNYDGFSVDEQKFFLETADHNSDYENYEFHNVMEVGRDFQKGFWKWN